MVRLVLGVLSSCLLVAFLIAVGIGSSAREMRSAQGEILIHEVQSDPSPSGSENAYEWFELYNPGAESVSLAGWRIQDNRAEDELPDIAIAAGGFLIVAGERFLELFPDYDGPLVTLRSIGNGLGNGGDRLRLLDAEGREVDAMSYGSDVSVLNPAPPAPPSGHSLERAPAGVDTDTAADWIVREIPSPGGPGDDVPQSTREPGPPAATVEATALPSPTAPIEPGPGGWPEVLINEYLPAPRYVDWDGDGVANRADEWIELYNAGSDEAYLRGWTLDDEAGGGSSPYTLPDDAVIAPGGHLLLFQRQTRLVLNNDADSVLLIRPDGTMADEHHYQRTLPDASWARVTDGASAWVDDMPPSPGGPNGGVAQPPSGSTPPSQLTPTPGTGPATATPPLVGFTPTPRAPATPVGTPVAPPDSPGTAPAYLPLLISEVLYDPLEPGNDAAYEWVELYNRGDVVASLAGWSIGDRQSWDLLGNIDVPPKGFAVVVATESLSRTLSGGSGMIGDAPLTVVADGRIGGGLGNTGDVVRLRGPTGELVDAVGWGSALEAFDPAAPIGPPGVSLERLPPWQDTDSAADWWIQTAPSPGRHGEMPEHLDAPALTINEVLPAPGVVDWDGDGEANHLDEWVELNSASGRVVDLERWELHVGEPVRWRQRFPPGTRIEPGGFLVIHRVDSGISLGNDGDSLRLIRPDGVQADRLTWTTSPGYDRSWSRRADGDRDAGWTADFAVTPGSPNRPLRDGESRRDDRGDRERPSRSAARTGVVKRLPPPAVAVALSDVRRLGRRTRVVVRGIVTAPPGTFGHREMMIGDDDGGVRLYMGRPDQHFPPFVLGDPVAAIGRLSDYRGERQVTLDAPADAWWDGVARPVTPVELPTGAIGEETEGRLVRVAGRAVAFAGTRITIDDGSGPARIIWRTATGLERPRLPRATWLEIIGIAGQSDGSAPYDEGYRVVPRFAEDVVVGSSWRYVAGTIALPAGSREGRGLVRRFPATGRALPTRRAGCGGATSCFRGGCGQAARHGDLAPRCQ